MAETVAMLLLYQANPNAISAGECRSPMHIAAASNTAAGAQILQELIRHGGELDACENALGNSPLHLAAQANSTAAVAILLRHRANTSLSNFRQQTALQLATTMRHMQVVALLTEQSSEP